MLQYAKTKLILIEDIYTNDTIIYDTLKTKENCDSVVIFTLKVNQYQTAKTLSVSLCSGGSYEWRNKIYNKAGVYRDTILINTSCDSIYVLNLTFKAPTTITLRDTICPGDSILYNGVYYNKATTIRDTFKNNQGCDSVVVKVISVANYKTTTKNLSLCQGSDITINGKNTM